MLANEAIKIRGAAEPSISAEATIVRRALEAKGLETPMFENGLSNEEKRIRIQAAMRDVMETLGLDLADDSLQDTPNRIAKMYVNEIFSGLDYRAFPKITQIENKMSIDQPVQVTGISLTSTCEHHFVTIDGTATVSYIPKDKVLGLSKINRLVGFFAQRPQVQERLTQQVMVAIQALTGTDDVAVTINATHYCVKARGIRDSQSYTKTSSLGGAFNSNPDLRREFYNSTQSIG
nr:GTP cyclohydrolase I FolE [uncultured Glaciecola sp.]